MSPTRTRNSTGPAKLRGRAGCFRAKLTHVTPKKKTLKSGKRSRRAARPTHGDDGVDLTLIRWMLSLTPEERLIILQENVRNIELMLEGYRVPEFPRLVTVKAETPRERDMKVLAILKRTLEEKSRK